MLKFVVMASTALLATALYKNEVLPGPGVLRAEIAQEPVQQPLQVPPFKTSVGGVDYTIEPSHSYDIHGLVVSKHNADTWWDWVHRASNDHLNVTDVCVVWGHNATSGAYVPMAFSSGQWTCNWQTASLDAFNAFDSSQISNNHVLTDNPALAKKLRSLRIGDQIRISGQLAAYRHQSGMDFFRGTSTVRTDTGNGACETIFVSALDILQPATALWRCLAWAAGAVLALCAALGLVLPHRARN